jgi:hypothetical protein
MKLKTFVLIVAFTVAVGVGIMLKSALVKASPLQSVVVTYSQVGWESGLPEALVAGFGLAIRSDGSYVRFEQESNPLLPRLPVFAKRIYDFQKGTTTFVDSNIKTTDTTRIDDANNIRKIEPTTICVGRPAGEILGYKVYYSEKTNYFDSPMEGLPIPQRHRDIAKSWKAPALGCEDLRTELTTSWDKSGQWEFEQSTITQAVLAQTESVDHFFTVPDHFKELPSGDRLKLEHQMFPNFYPEPAPEQVKSENDWYDRHKP